MNKAAKQSKRNDAPAPNHGSHRRWLFSILLLAAAASGTWALFEYVIWNTVPPELVGKWELTNGPQKGEFEFRRGNRLVGHIENPRTGNSDDLDARIRVDGDTIHITTQNPFTGEPMTVAQKILSLTDTELVLQDSQGKRLVMRRVE